MTERSLQVTYRKGRPFAAYLHLLHQTGERAPRQCPRPTEAANGELVEGPKRALRVLPLPRSLPCREHQQDET